LHHLISWITAEILAENFPDDQSRAIFGLGQGSRNEIGSRGFKSQAHQNGSLTMPFLSQIRSDQRHRAKAETLSPMN
jgi:hypothetical protein